MATPNSGDGVLDLESGDTHDQRDTAAAPKSNNDGLPVDVHNGGGGLSSPASRPKKPRQKPRGAKKRSSKASEADDSADSYTGAALMFLALYYFFFVFYMIGSSEKWWHAAVGIAVASAFLLLSFCVATCNQDFTTPLEGRRNVVKPAADRESDLGRRLIESDRESDLV